MAEENALAGPNKFDRSLLPQMDDVLDDTTGRPTGALDGLSIFRQGKEDYFYAPGDKKVTSVTGIFALSVRPMRAWWEKEELTGDAPVCFSFDGVSPVATAPKKQSEKCNDCAHDKFGTAKVGRGKSCKTRATDFALLLRDNIPIEGGIALVNPEKDIVGPALVQYSIGNRETSEAFANFVNECRAKGLRPQGVVARWEWTKGKSKTGVEFSACVLKAVAPLMSADHDPQLWALIVNTVKNLKDGQAHMILTMLSGSAQTE